MSLLKVHILYEYGVDLRPHSSAFIRLLRPLTHPAFSNKIQVSTSLDYNGEKVDAVIVDRLWQPYDISPTMAQELVSEIHDTGAKFIYALDDNFLDLLTLPMSSAPSWFTQKHLWIVKFWLQEADLVIVTTPTLKERFSSLNSNIVIIPNMLDDRLLVNANTISTNTLFPKRRLTIGYMGTLTHNEDLSMITPALQEIGKRYPDSVEFQLVGGVDNLNSLADLNSMIIRQVAPMLGEMEYPLFMLWFTNQLNWDIAIAPLKDTEFNRGKSDLKFLDYSTVGAAGIYSRVPAYQNTVRHQVTGWLTNNTTEDWVNALDTLIAKDNLRKDLAQNALKYLYSERVVPCFVRQWSKTIQSLLVM